MANQQGFTQKQVESAILAGLRSGGRDTRLSAGRAAERAATHRSILAHYREHAQESLSNGDHLQAAEKSWGAFAQTIKAIGADHRLSVSHHAGIVGVADQLTLLVGASDAVSGAVLRQGLAFARSLHQHFYENDLSNATVVANTGEVSEAIDLLQELFPPEQSP